MNEMLWNRLEKGVEEEKQEESGRGEEEEGKETASEDE